MQPNLAVHNVNSADVMPIWFTCTANPNDVMCGVCNMPMQASQVSLCNIDAPHYTYWPCMHGCWPTVNY